MSSAPAHTSSTPQRQESSRVRWCRWSSPLLIDAGGAHPTAHAAILPGFGKVDARDCHPGSCDQTVCASEAGPRASADGSQPVRATVRAVRSVQRPRPWPRSAY